MRRMGRTMRNLVHGRFPALPSVMIVMIALSAASWADTVYLRNGSSIDGVVLGKHEGQVIMQIGNLGRMEIPEKDVQTIEKNARTGPINPDRGEKRRDNPVGDLEKKNEREAEAKKGSRGLTVEDAISPELEKEIKELVYDLTRQRSATRTRAERKLADIGKPAVSYVRAVTTHASELTRIAAFRILKKTPVVESTEAAIVGLTDEVRFVRKLSWETLQEITGENWVFPWDDSATDRERDQAKIKWTEWWKVEKARLEKEAEKKAARD